MRRVVGSEEGSAGGCAVRVLVERCAVRVIGVVRVVELAEVCLGWSQQETGQKEHGRSPG